jgi:alkylation response protein AidB-like acyl-CoA dehydrogenase
MDFFLTDHQKLIRDTVRQFMETEVRPLVKDLEREEKFPLELLKKLGEMGCCGMLTPEEWGGPGLDTVSYVLMLEEVSRVYTAMSTALGVTNSAVQAPLNQFGTAAQKEKYLRRLASGEILGSFCLTEAAAGSDAAGIQATANARHSPLATSHYVLNGAKTWVTNGAHAGLYIIFAKTDPQAGGKGMTAFLVEPTFPGFKIGRHEDKMGQRSSPSVEILLNNCEVPAANRLGDEGQGLKIALSALDGGRIGIAAQAVGIAQAGYDVAVQFAKEREAFGHKISDFQAIQHKLANMSMEIDAARLLVLRAAWLKDQGRPHTEAGAKAKLFASEMARRQTAEAIQVLGGYGYTKEFPVERYYRDAKVTEIYEGTSEIQRLVIARSLLRDTAGVRHTHETRNEA